MLEFVQNQILFLAALFFLLFLPGWSLLSAILGKRKTLSVLEKFILSFGLSLVSVDFIFFAVDRLKIPINRWSSFLASGIFILANLAIYKIRKIKNDPEKDGEEKLFDFSRRQFWLILLLLFSVFFIKTWYLSGSVLPTATDMGHHMYWSNWLVQNEKLPVYDGMPDFIIGEHVVFGLVSLLTGLDFFSAFPVVLLYLFNLLGILAVFIMVLRIFKNTTVAILSLLFLGTLYAVSSPQAKFVSGGVIGNVLGNFLIPLVFYGYFRAMEFLKTDKNSARIFLSLAVFLTFGLFYTHHLSSFVFLFIFALLILLFFLANGKEIKKTAREMISLVFSPWTIAVFVLGIVFFFFIFTPNYARLSAVDTAVGTPLKETRVGLTWDNLRSTVGDARLALGFLGLLIVVLNKKRKDFGHLLFFSWFLMIFLLSVRPGWFLVDIPSNRIGNYLTYPAAVLSAYAFYFIFSGKFFEKKPGTIQAKIFPAVFAVVFVFSLAGGIQDSADAFKSPSDSREMAEVFGASRYLADRTAVNDIILKDHNYLAADAWIKLFFMRGYKYPDSRGYFRRYEDAINPREMCTLYMISSPAGENAQKCFAETGTDFLMVNPLFDGSQFKKLPDFNRIYSGDSVAVYYKNN